MTDSAATFDIDMSQGILKLAPQGDWRARFLGDLDERLRDFADDSVGRDLIIDMGDVQRLDTVGAMMLQRTLHACQSRTEASGFVRASDAHASLLDQIESHLAPCHVEPLHGNAFVAVLRRLGMGAWDAILAGQALLSFIGETLATAARAITDPRRIRWTSTVHHMEEAGLNAIPIIGLMSFLIGAVVAFMGAKILSLFNADIFTVELVGISVLREFGVLLSAILIAGRSGSAFTAQIGSMKIREEIDAMRVLGLDPIETLVLPRVAALVIMLLITTLLSFGIRESARANNIMVAIKVTVVVLFIVVGVRHVQPANWQPFMPFGMEGVFGAAAIVFFAFIGFDAVTSAAEEVRNPKRDLPIGIIGSLAVCTILYVLVAAIMTGIVPFAKFAGVDHPVSLALQVAGESWVAGFVDLGAIIGMTTVILVMAYGQTRIIFAMSRDGLLPKRLSHIHPRYATPFLNTWVVGIVFAVIAAFVPLNVLAELINIGTLAAFSLIAVAVLVLRRTRPDLHR
ncbi:MAG: amino acid permease, partial [Pseudomonadota bacterium]